MFAEVIIPLALPKNYTWSIPAHLSEQALPGMRVEVVLGKNKKYAGLIRNVHDKPPAGYQTKNILSVLDAEPVLFPHQFRLWEWIAAYYMCSEGEVMSAALPAHFKLSSETVLAWNESFGEDLSSLDNDEFVVAEALQLKKTLTISEVQGVLDHVGVYPVINRLIGKRVCFVWESLKERYQPKKETFILLHPAYNNEDALADLLNNWSRAPKQMELLLAYLHLMKTEGEVSRRQLLSKSGASEAQLKGLIDKGILLSERKPVERITTAAREIHIDFELSSAQDVALKELRSRLQEHPVCLLHGVTSSGKTQVYIRLIEEFVRQDRQVLYLLPEIALTSQIIRRLRKHFGGYIGIYHSKFSQNERIEIWNKTKSGELKVVVGARSALFLPFNGLGLVIVDEEHDTSYKQQDPAPRYNARDAAVFYASMVDAKVVLGSATPSVETYYNAVQKKYGLVELNERYGGISLPSIEIVDTKVRFRKQSDKLMVTPALEADIRHTIGSGKQVILFQNRRGYAPFQVCQVCGWLPHCKNCDVTLTFHKRTQKLHCHYCGEQYNKVLTCAACGSDKLDQKSFGTEKVEEQLQEMFPAARIARMDVDSVRGKHAHDQLIQSFEQGAVDVLVGTQMVVKGLDFEHVQLVGVMDADSLLSFADYRVNERAFQLMEQVSGRAGRKGEQGKVAIQVANTRHPVLQFLMQHDYKGFFEHEIIARRQFFYPPFSRTILLTFRHRSKDIVDAAARTFSQAMSARYGKYLVGPAEPVVNRIRDQYLMELLFKLPKDSLTLRACKESIHDQIVRLHAEPKFKNVTVIPDVDH